MLDDIGPPSSLSSFLFVIDYPLRDVSLDSLKIRGDHNPFTSVGVLPRLDDPKVPSLPLLLALGLFSVVVL